MQTKRKNIFLICATSPEWAPLKKVIPFTKMDLDAPLTLPSPSLVRRSFGEGGRGEGGLEGDSSFSIKLVQTGVGTKNLPKLFSHFRSVEPRPSLICSFGLSGGLNDLLKVGDMVLPNQFVDDKGAVLEGDDVVSLSNQGDMVERSRLVLKELDFDFTEGVLFTSPRVLATEAKKREAGKKYGAVAVDMETYPAAQFCREEKIPFLSVRSIFDPVAWNLEDLGGSKMIDEHGNFRMLPAIGSFLKNPKLTFRLPHYQKSLSLGSGRLARFFCAFLENIYS